MTRSKWATVALSLWVGFVALIVTAGSCSVDKKSDQFQTCERQADCSNGESCINGVCLPPDTLDDANDPDGNNPDGNQCPSQCTSCRTVQGVKTCVVDCMVSGPLCNAPIVCPAGFDCDIKCSTQNACQKGITCSGEQDCAITCSGRASCRDISCGDGRCNVMCSGEVSCRDIACNDACACDVGCANNALCENVMCTSPLCVGGGTSLRGCTSNKQGCNTCTGG